MISFYLSKNTTMYGESYALTSFEPKASPSHCPLSWFFWPPTENDLLFALSKEEGQKLENKNRTKLMPGEYVRLGTTSIVQIKKAPKFER